MKQTIFTDSNWSVEGNWLRTVTDHVIVSPSEKRNMTSCSLKPVDIISKRERRRVKKVGARRGKQCAVDELNKAIIAIDRKCFRKRDSMRWIGFNKTISSEEEGQRE